MNLGDSKKMAVATGPIIQVDKVDESLDETKRVRKSSQKPYNKKKSKRLSQGKNWLHYITEGP